MYSVSLIVVSGVRNVSETIYLVLTTSHNYHGKASTPHSYGRITKMGLTGMLHVPRQPETRIPRAPPPKRGSLGIQTL